MLETTLQTGKGDTVEVRQELQRSDALDMITALADWVASPDSTGPDGSPAPTKVESWEYEIEHVCRMTFEPEREVTCGCGRKGVAYTLSTTFVTAPPGQDPVRWVRPPPGWFVFAGGDRRRIDDGKVIEGPFVRCTVCMSEWKPPPLRDSEASE